MGSSSSLVKDASLGSKKPRTLVSVGSNPTGPISILMSGAFIHFIIVDDGWRGKLEK